MEEKLLTAGVMFVNLVWLCVQTWRVWSSKRLEGRNG